MEVRRLSADALWVEMPLSAQTCLLVWHAMAECGLRDGQINSFKEEHFGPLYSWQPHLIEGRTPSGLFARDNVRVQIQLVAEDGGSRLKFYAAHPKGGVDFGASTRFRKRLLPLVEQVLRDAPLDWQQANQEGRDKRVAPLASPHDTGPAIVHTIPAFETIVSLAKTPLSLKERIRLWGGFFGLFIGFMIVSRLHLWGPVFLVYAGWEAWKWYKDRKTWSWLSLMHFLFFGALGIYNSVAVIRRWF